MVKSLHEKNRVIRLHPTLYTMQLFINIIYDNGYVYFSLPLICLGGEDVNGIRICLADSKRLRWK